jgi:hypothetical protein
VDHETALESANQALGSGRRSERGISSVELQSVSSTLYSDGPRSQARVDTVASISSELWQAAGMVVVVIATLSFVVSLWLM